MTILEAEMALDDVLSPKATADTWTAVLVYGVSHELADLAAWLIMPYVADRAKPLKAAGSVGALALLRRPIPAELVAAFATNRRRSELVQQRALRHPNCPAEVIAAASDRIEEWHDRAQLHLEWIDPLSRPDCSPQELIEFCNTDCWRSAVVNPACPDEGLFAALARLAGEPRQQTRRNPNDPPPRRHPRRTWKPDRFELNARASFDAARHLCARLGKAPWEWLRNQPLSRLNPADRAQLLWSHRFAAADDPNSAMRTLVASLPDVEPALLAKLAADPDPEVRAAASRRVLHASLSTSA